MGKVIVSNLEKLENIKERIREQGAENLQIISDFDRTLTYGLAGEKRTVTVISQLRSDVKYLGENYSKQAHKLFDIYHPIEIDSNVSLEEKKIKMHEWWKKHFDLIIECGLDKDILEQVINEKKLKFRKGILDFIRVLEDKEIPLIIMSAAPGDMIQDYMKKDNLFKDNVYILGNLYEFDENGKAIKIKEPIIHTFNKSEISLKSHSKYSEFVRRKNVILLGDSVGDVDMVEGFEYDNLIKIGFLNEDVEKNLESYKKFYDVVLTEDQDLDYVNNLLRELIN